jgi:riboflavin kinase/FMN adenylyltransferase
MENMGIQNLVIHPFDTVFSQLTAEEFVRTVLVNQFDIHKIIGHDHRFGRDRTANIDDLISLGNDMGLRSSRYLYKNNDLSISSTKIRKAISGNMPLANEYLGTLFLSGTVFKGKQLGRTIGSPPQT